MALSDFDMSIAKLEKARQALIRENLANGRPVADEIQDINRSIQQLIEAAAEQAFRHYHPFEAARRDRERER